MNPTNIPSFGPTQTVNYLKCPTLRQFERNWQKRGPWAPHLAVGAAMSEALARYLLSPGEAGFDAALGAAQDILRARYVESEEWSLEGLFKLVERGFSVAASTTLKDFLEQETVLATELSIGEGRIDLVTRSKATKQIIITDHKNSIQMKSQYVNKKLAETDLSWQLWDYAWRASSYYGEPVTWIRTHLTIMSPKAVAFQHPVKILPEAIEAWAASASQHWDQMAKHDTMAFDKLPMNWNECINKYGKCPAYDACHVLLRDESKMETLYERKSHGQSA